MGICRIVPEQPTDKGGHPTQSHRYNSQSQAGTRSVQGCNKTNQREEITTQQNAQHNPHIERSTSEQKDRESCHNRTRKHTDLLVGASSLPLFFTPPLFLSPCLSIHLFVENTPKTHHDKPHGSPSGVYCPSACRDRINRCGEKQRDRVIHHQHPAP